MGFRHAITKFGMVIKKNSPAILSVAGSVAIIGGVVWACKAAVDASDDIKGTKQDVAEIKQSIEDGVIEKKEGKKMIFKTRLECARVCAFKFAGPATLIAGGLVMKRHGEKILGKRLDGTAAALTALTNKHNTLVENVKKEYGEAEYKRLQYGMTSETQEVRVQQENGVETAKMENFDGVVDLNKVGKFTLIFDHNSRWHHSDVLHNENFLISCEQTFTERLRRTGILWLSDVMKEMDIRPKNQDEAVLARYICWTYDPKDKNKDCCVKLRWEQVFDGDSRNFDTGYNPVFLLDPNYDTNINQNWLQFVR